MGKRVMSFQILADSLLANDCLIKQSCSYSSRTAIFKSASIKHIIRASKLQILCRSHTPSSSSESINSMHD